MQVLFHEMRAIQKACFDELGENYQPAITFIVAIKRHHGRFIVCNPRDGVNCFFVFCCCCCCCCCCFQKKKQKQKTIKMGQQSQVLWFVSRVNIFPVEPAEGRKRSKKYFKIIFDIYTVHAVHSMQKSLMRIETLSLHFI